VDYWPFGVLALAAIVFGGVSPFAIPLVGLVGIGMLGYYAWVGLQQRRDDDRDV
jgi:hypothetical protein